MGFNVTRAVVLVVLMSAIVFSVEIRHKCQNDAECSNWATITNTYYCQNGFCERCFPCQVANRLPSPTTPGCARGEDDCGSCSPGFHAEDLTVQRRTFKCFPNAEDSSSPVAQSVSSTWMVILLVSSGIVLVALVITGFTARFLKRSPAPQAEVKKQPSVNEENLRLMRLASGGPPPPYEDSTDETDESGHVGSVRMSERRTVVYLERDIITQATPMGRPSHPFADANAPEEEDLHLEEEVPDADVHVDDSGSTETIPSLWEHDQSGFNMIVTPPVDSPNPSIFEQQEAPTPVHVSSRSSPPILFRSQSLEMPLVHRSSLSLSCSDPSIPFGIERLRSCSLRGESYRHRHVRLSNYRISSLQAINPETRPVDSTSSLELSNQYNDDEPGTPQPFLFRDDFTSDSPVPYQASVIATSLAQHLLPPVHRGSQDSGFFDQSRRRTRQQQTVEELEIGFYVSLSKRRRDDCS